MAGSLRHLLVGGLILIPLVLGESCTNQVPHQPLVRLAVQGMPIEPVRLPPTSEAKRLVGPQDLTRPAFRLVPGESRTVPARLGKGARLRLALAAERCRTDAKLTLEVRLNDRLIHEEIAGAADGGWQSVVVPLPSRGEAKLALGCRLDGRAARNPAKRPVLLVATPRITHPRSEPPRILLWISQDTVRSDHLHGFGYQRPTSLSFERLAREWVVFDNAIAPAPWTLPSLASQFTSRYPSFHGAVFTDRSRDARQPTLFQALAEKGFTVLGVTANRFVSRDFAMSDGFDALWYTPGRAGDVNRLALRLLDEWDGEDLALFVHYIDPHAPYAPPTPYNTLFTDPTYRGRLARAKSVDEKQFGAVVSSADLAHVVALYDGELAYTDAQIGELLTALDRRGLLARAVVAYSADHGEELLDRGGWGHNATLYDEVLRVPLALRLPGVQPRRVKQTVSLVDLPATLLEALGIAPPASFRGRSLLGLARGDSPATDAVYAETEHTYKQRRQKLAVYEGGLKLVRIIERDTAQIVSEDLYDLATDPHEARPLDRDPRRERLRRLLDSYQTSARAQGSVSGAARIDPDVERTLRALGYIR